MTTDELIDEFVGYAKHSVSQNPESGERWLSIRLFSAFPGFASRLMRRNDYKLLAYKPNTGAAELLRKEEEAPL